MTSLTGALSGTKVVVSIESAPLSGSYLPVPGETAHSLTQALEAIEISNKSDSDQRVFLEGEGRNLLDLTIEAINNTDAAYLLLYSNFDARTFPRLRRTAGTRTITSQYVITAISDNPSLNTGVADSFTLSSHGPITIT